MILFLKFCLVPIQNFVFMFAECIINLSQNPSANEQNISHWPEAIVSCVIIICITLILIKIGGFLRDMFEVKQCNDYRRERN